MISLPEANRDMDEAECRFCSRCIPDPEGLGAQRKRREAISVERGGVGEVDRGITYSLAHYLYPRDTRSALILFH